MILQELVKYYDRLSADPNDPMTPAGFSREKISFAVVIDPDGGNAELLDVRDPQGKKFFPAIMPVPDRGGRSGTALKPNFLWDNTGYALGRDSKGKPDRSTQAFESFRDFHAKMADAIDDEELAAVVRFLQTWTPDRADAFPLFAEAIDKNVVFRIKGRTHFVHQSPAITREWKAPVAEGETVVIGQSLVGGDTGPLARLHPLIGGVKDAQTMGAALASFNLDAFTSYGLEQTYNAPVSVTDAFKYTTALNRLLESRQRRVQIGDATVVFWAAAPTLLEDVAADFFNEPSPKADAPPEDKQRAEQARTFLTQLRDGHAHGNAFEADSDVGFYVLGLSPNASRLSVRFWIQANVAEMTERLRQFMNEVKIVGANPDQPMTIRRVVNATARVINDKPDYDTLSPRLSGDVARAVLHGHRFPEHLLSAILDRIRSDSQISPSRAAALKAFVIRNGKIPMDPYLDKLHPEPAYHCGRLLAVLAFAQEEALGAVNSGVIRRTLGSVMATPGLQLGRLQRAAEVGHIPKLKRNVPDFVRDELKFINCALRNEVPLRLSPLEQSVFMLGFYQQLQYLDFVSGQVSSGTRVRTKQGEWVRSNGEKQLAELLTKLGIPYVYEPAAMLPSGSERWPDFMVRSTTKAGTVFIEYLGMDTEQYNNRWDEKVKAFAEGGITVAGGLNGKLAIVDARKGRLDDVAILDALRPYLNLHNNSLAEDAAEGKE